MRIFTQDNGVVELDRNFLTVVSDPSEPGGLTDISSVKLTPAEAVNLASSLLQWATATRDATQNRGA